MLSFVVALVTICFVLKVLQIFKFVAWFLLLIFISKSPILILSLYVFAFVKD